MIPTTVGHQKPTLVASDGMSDPRSDIKCAHTDTGLCHDAVDRPTASSNVITHSMADLVHMWVYSHVGAILGEATIFLECIFIMYDLYT